MVVKGRLGETDRTRSARIASLKVVLKDCTEAQINGLQYSLLKLQRNKGQNDSIASLVCGLGSNHEI